jgi:hypothetical protein
MTAAMTAETGATIAGIGAKPLAVRDGGRFAGAGK